MAEHWWHEVARESIFSSLKPSRAYQSHSDLSKLYLFRLENEAKPARKNCLSDADIIVLDTNSNRISKIIEIETAVNPKKFIGIVLTTHLCNMCSYRRDSNAPKSYLPLHDITLEIFYRKAPPKSKKDLKIMAFESAVRKIVAATEGCISTVPEVQVFFRSYEVAPKQPVQ